MSSSVYPERALQWILEQDEATSVDQLADNGIFGTLSAKISAALTLCFTGEFARRMGVIEEQYLKKHRKMIPNYARPQCGGIGA